MYQFILSGLVSKEAQKSPEFDLNQSMAIHDGTASQDGQNAEE